MTESTRREWPDADARTPELWQIVLAAVIAVAFIQLATFLNGVIWTNAYMTGSRLAVLPVTIVLSLGVGLAQKYLRAPTVMTAASRSRSRVGASAQTTGHSRALCFQQCARSCPAPVSVAVLVQDIAAWMRDKLHISSSTALGFDVAARAAAFNGIVGNPLFTGVFATEYEVGAPSASHYLVWNLLAGVIGFAFYELLGLTAFAGAVAFTPVTHLEPLYFVWAVVLGVVGAAVALYTATNMQLFGRLIGRLFGTHAVIRSLAAGTVIGLVGTLVPELLFSGEQQIHAIRFGGLWRGDAPAACTIEADAAGAVVQERLPGRPDFPDHVHVHDARVDAGSHLSGRPVIGAGSLHRGSGGGPRAGRADDGHCPGPDRGWLEP